MNLTNILSVSGLSGLFKMKANRSNGLIIENLETKKSRFASSRRHQFTPLESIAVYTETDAINLDVVFEIIMKYEETGILPENSSSAEELKTFFAEILPDYDKNRVFVKHIKRILNWYGQLKSANLLVVASEEEE